MKFQSLLIALSFSLSVLTLSAQKKLQAGVWRGELTNSTDHKLPFNFEVSTVAGKQQLAIINGAERFKVTDVKIKGDSVFIHMPLFDSEFRLKFKESGLAGLWIKHLGEKDAAMPFTAQPNTPWRFFKTSEKPAYNVAGRWSAIFGEGDGRDTTVGEFKQVGSKLTGTFLTTTGDYRYLEGTVAGDQLYLSCFDGGHAYLFNAKINDARTITDGKLFASLTGKSVWLASKNENAKLPDAYSLTALKPGFTKLAFTFKDLTGKPVSLTDERFKNKVVIVQILGSWCPNCMDETAYMVNYYKKYHKKGVEIIGLAYERTNDFKHSQKTVQQVKTRFNVPYSLLIPPFTNSNGDPAKSLPMMAKVVGFPTTIIIDKKGDVRKIHTGFSGPGTGHYYTEFVDEFQHLTDGLLAEN